MLRRFIPISDAEPACAQQPDTSGYTPREDETITETPLRGRTPLRRMPTELVRTTRMRAVTQSDIQRSQRRSGVVPRYGRPFDVPDALNPIRVQHEPLNREAPRAPTRTTRPQWGVAVPVAPAQTVERECHPLEWLEPELCTLEPSAPEPSFRVAFEANWAGDPTLEALAQAQRERASALEALAQAQRECASALEHARSTEERAQAAERRALLAERLLQSCHGEPQSAHAARPRQSSLLRSSLLALLAGLAIGGYLSLFFPVGERALKQRTLLRELQALKQEVREENEAVRSRLEALSPAPEVHARPGASSGASK